MRYQLFTNSKSLITIFRCYFVRYYVGYHWVSTIVKVEVDNKRLLCFAPHAFTFPLPTNP